MKEKKKIWIMIMLIGLITLSACGGSADYSKVLIGSWYHEGSETPAFILYDDGTCEITGEYGAGSWEIDENNQLILYNYYGESEMAPIISVEKGCLILGEQNEKIVLYNKMVDNSDLSHKGKVSEYEENNLVDINVFEDIVINYSGWNGLGKIDHIDTSGCSQFIQENFKFVPVEDYQNLSHGDQVQVQVVFDKEFVNKNGYNVSEENHSFYVSNLNTILESDGYYDGVAWVRTSQDGWCVCDKEGNSLYTLSEDFVRPTTHFYNGVSLVDERALVDKNGNVIWSISDGYDYAKQRWGDAIEEVKVCYAYGVDYGKDFFGKIFVHFFVNSYEFTGDYMGILDSSGNWILEPAEGYKEVRSYEYGKNGIFEFRTSFGGYPDYLFYNAITDDKIKGLDESVLEQWKREYYCSTHDGLIYEERGGNGYFCDVDGNEVINLSGYNIHANWVEFSSGYALLPILNESGYEFFTIIDRDGNELFDPKSRDNEPEGMMNGFYRIGNQYFNVKCEPICDLLFSECNDFLEGMALIKLAEDGTLHFINEKGEIVY